MRLPTDPSGFVVVFTHRSFASVSIVADGIGLIDTGLLLVRVGIVAALLERYEIVSGIFHGFDYMPGIHGAPMERLQCLAGAIDWVLKWAEIEAGKAQSPEDKKKAHRRYLDLVLELSPEELAFYDALAENESAVDAMGSEQLRLIAHELLEQLRRNATVDWHHRESARARMRVLVKRILKKYGYPPDLSDAAVQTVLAQAEVLLREVSGKNQ
ncbi:type I restriction enzyme endonuclease domain-containing protein [Novosphingobium sp.]|uniref:type I restriction enzyme endonuclease domain-containing protein n=1 Tax=Novosphingobium sp. TaxID=1874826 RepID=UPI00262C5BD5|nr:type I restriction enzyme endonuclease domain-containing protein [Novosphingobium sp.]